ncbi:S8 family serine peptidase [Sporanaerobacter acetigenes]|uniref:Peptidase inhibitor I9 n=1 Tax=Sporanaerobacter acetigenes DSM 13106 TaxID=1123281 RepID=A0A1M5TB38_9FIRM|nr:S8 family serine peptidase [Sporanaerobacter acetigenes]SHH48007.1 Peptidase inhibitor I9 [Sporanaerobacter acetigenes DSM 13106]
MRNIKKILSIVLALALFIPTLASAKSVDFETVQVDENLKVLEETGKEKFEGKQDIEIKGKVRVVVELKKEPAINLAAAKGIEYAELNKGERQKLEGEILSEQNAVLNDMESKNIAIEFDKKEELPRFTTAFNGFAGFVEYEDIEKIEELPRVEKVYISNEYERPVLEMSSSTGMVKAVPTWELGYKGEGTVIAIIDTGVDPRHKDMVLSEETEPKLTKEDVANKIKEDNLKGNYYTAKVPYGYNYYDLNNEILDLGPEASEHGMHVAGTVGANGNPDEGGVRGVAPEAQILAMKVFSNDPIYSTTFDDIYLDAIDEAIKLGADVLNMSLGSTASFYEQENPVNVAITNAVNNGIVCSISAGNSGYLSYGYDNPIKQNPDIGLVGAPGLSYDSIQVASIENLELSVPYLSYEENDENDEGEESLPKNSAIVGDDAYDFGYLNMTPIAQKAVVDTRKVDGQVYLKLGEKKIVDMDGREIEVENKEVEYFYPNGQKSYKLFGEMITPSGNFLKIPMMVAGSINPAKVIKDKIEFVDCGIGTPAELENAEGKVALIIRGGLPFTEKIVNAQNAGAKGVIVYNHANGGEELVSMMYPPKGNIPAVFIGHNGGLALLELEEKYIKFHDDVMKTPNPSGGTMSDFSSWGTTPTLELKPEITAPGGQIYSTLQNNNYGVMSGTSMAAPHVTGGSALVRQYIKQDDRYKDLSVGEQARLAKVLLMNTAEVVSDEDGMPYSPRKQGAGIMNLYGAVSTPVRVINVNNGEAKVELKDFESTNFSMNLKAINDSDEDITYKVKVDVLTDLIYNYKGTEYNLLQTRKMVADVSPLGDITVPANSSTEFTVSVDFSNDPEAYRNMFVEGFVRLEEVTNTHPNLTVPYVGFYGNWDEPSIVDGFKDLGEEAFYKMTGMLDNQNYFMIPGKAAISPGTPAGKLNGTDTVTPLLSFLRNAEEVQYNILNKDEENLRTIKTEQFVRKNYIDGSRKRPEYSFRTDRIWNGKVGDEIVEDGLYYYQIKAKIQNSDSWQEKNIPVYVDTEAPIITDVIYNPTTGNISWKATDETSGLMAFDIWVGNEKVANGIKAQEGKGEYEYPIEEIIHGMTNPEVTVVGFDYAANAGMKSIVVDYAVPSIYLTSPTLLDPYKERDILVEGAVFDVENPIVKINGVEIETVYDENITVLNPDNPKEVARTGAGYKYSTTMNFPDGYNNVSVEVFSSNGGFMSIARRFYVDSTPPELNIKVKERDSSSDKVELEINMKDKFPFLLLYVRDSEEFRFDGMELSSDVHPVDETITVEVPLKEGDNSITVKLIDFAGNETVKTINVNRTNGIVEETEVEPENPIVTQPIEEQIEE